VEAAASKPRPSNTVLIFSTSLFCS